MELQRVADGVYACILPDRGFCWSNSGFVARGGGLVVDSLTDVRSMRRALELYAGVAPDVALQGTGQGRAEGHLGHQGLGQDQSLVVDPAPVPLDEGLEDQSGRLEEQHGGRGGQDRPG